MKPITLKELRDLLSGGYSRKAVASILRSRGIDSNVSASDVVALLTFNDSQPKSLFDLGVEYNSGITADEFFKKQEKLTVFIWLPLALATMCAMLCMSKGINIPVHTFLSAWGLRRLAKLTNSEPSKEERDEAFLKAVGV